MKIVLAFLIVIFLFSACGISQESENQTGDISDIKNETIPQVVKEEANANNSMDLLDSIPAIDYELMSDKQLVNGWIYFLYPNLEYPTEDAHELYRWREDETDLTRISSMRCDFYTVLDGNVYFADYTMMGAEHGVLYVIKPDQKPKELADELCFYQIVDSYIYYAHSFDTLGVGIEGHALHRIGLDGENHMIAAYEVGIPGNRTWHIGDIRDGYIYYDRVRVKLGEPADGMEEVQIITPIETDNDDGWLYYTTNRLFRAKPDGTQRTVLDGNESTWLGIGSVDGEWIYYLDNIRIKHYKIRKDGSEKTEIGTAEYYDRENDNNSNS